MDQAVVQNIRDMVRNLTAQFELISSSVDSLRVQSSSAVAAEYTDIKLINDAHVEAGRILAKVIDEIKHTVLPEIFERDGVSSFTTVSGYRVTVSATVRANMTNKEIAYEWLRQNNLGDIITETVNASTLSAVARGMLEEGKELPEEGFKTYIQNTTSVTKVK